MITRDLIEEMIDEVNEKFAKADNVPERNALGQARSGLLSLRWLLKKNPKYFNKEGYGA